MSREISGNLPTKLFEEIKNLQTINETTPDPSKLKPMLDEYQKYIQTQYIDNMASNSNYHAIIGASRFTINENDFNKLCFIIKMFTEVLEPMFTYMDKTNLTYVPVHGRDKGITLLPTDSIIEFYNNYDLSNITFNNLPIYDELKVRNVKVIVPDLFDKPVYRKIKQL